MSRATEALLAKIKKCLALARSGNEHEAAAALAKARALMDEYGITLDDIALAELGEASAKGSMTQRPPTWEALLCRTVRHAVGCKVIIAADLQRIYIGPRPAPEIASYAFAVLFRRLKGARQDYIRTTLKRCRPARKRQRADVFCEAWAYAVYSKIKALMPPVDQHEKIDQYIARRFASLSEVSSRAPSTKRGRLENDYWRGHHAGRAVDLAISMGTGAQPLRIA
ncbi:MAG: DUF2786 domain-containing protein [Sphingobium sp.]|uniref:DUF2786 domain-containing protein n=1 Tax=Sphingobium sp. TaxID=1912891 RepID=UPI002E20BE95